MFGRSDHDSAAVRAAFRTLPFAGLFAWGEIGPIHGRSVLHSFTAVLGLLTYRPETGDDARQGES
jgi:small ligand-binding sensory domain FIST